MIIEPTVRHSRPNMYSNIFFYFTFSLHRTNISSLPLLFSLFFLSFLLQARFFQLLLLFFFFFFFFFFVLLLLLHGWVLSSSSLFSFFFSFFLLHFGFFSQLPIIIYYSSFFLFLHAMIVEMAEGSQGCLV